MVFYDIVLEQISQNESLTIQNTDFVCISYLLFLYFLNYQKQTHNYKYLEGSAFVNSSLVAL